MSFAVQHALVACTRTSLVAWCAAAERRRTPHHALTSRSAYAAIQCVGRRHFDRWTRHMADAAALLSALGAAWAAFERRALSRVLCGWSLLSHAHGLASVASRRHLACVLDTWRRRASLSASLARSHCEAMRHHVLLHTRSALLCLARQSRQQRMCARMTRLRHLLSAAEALQHWRATGVRLACVRGRVAAHRHRRCAEAVVRWVELLHRRRVGRQQQELAHELLGRRCLRRWRCGCELRAVNRSHESRGAARHSQRCVTQWRARCARGAALAKVRDDAEKKRCVDAQGVALRTWHRFRLMRRERRRAKASIQQLAARAASEAAFERWRHCLRQKQGFAERVERLQQGRAKRQMRQIVTEWRGKQRALRAFEATCTAGEEARWLRRVPAS